MNTIGALIETLQEIENQELPIYVDNQPPTGLVSYRGIYAELAITRGPEKSEETVVEPAGAGFDLSAYGMGWYQPGTSGISIKSPATVGELAEALRLSVGETFEGYKGGQFTMDYSTRLWVSEYGDAESLRVDRIEILDNRVDLWTEKEEDYW